MIAGVRARRKASRLPSSNSMAAVAIMVFGHSALTLMAYFPNSSCIPRVSMLMPYLVTV